MGGARPNFFIVGAPRCGTTALYTFLRQHPQVFMPDRKELHLFSTDVAWDELTDSRHSVRDVHEYESMFASATEPRRGEASTSYLYSRVAARGLATYDPEARIIALIRSPIDMLCSLYGRFVWSGLETLPLRDALEAESAREQQRGSANRIDPQLRYRLITNLSDQLERYYEHFHRKQILVVVQEEMRTDPARIVREAFRFLDVDDSFIPRFGTINSHKETRSRVVQRMMRLPPVGVRSAVRSLSPRIINKIHRLNTREVVREGIDADLRADLRDQFAPMVWALEARLNRDLTEWWTDWRGCREPAATSVKVR